MHDIPKSFGKVWKNELLWARVTTVVLTAVASVFALYSGDLIAILGAFGWGTFAAAIVPVVAIGFNWKRATPFAANVAILTSLFINFFFKLFKIGLPYNIDVGAFSLIISLILFMSITLMSKPPKLDPAVEKVMDM